MKLKIMKVLAGGCTLLLLVSAGCSRKPEVIVYTALDRQFSEPILQAFEKETGIRVLTKYDTESTKTVGLVNTIIAEGNNPRCDVFWNNEIVNTIRLKERGLLQPCNPENADLYPAAFRDPDNTWFGFAARARVLIINTNALEEKNFPTSIFDLTEPGLSGKIGIAKPLFGTTASHMACLFAVLGPERAKSWLLDLKANNVIIESGNKMCAINTARGATYAAMTDTDDAIIELRNGAPVQIVFPDSQENGIGTLLIPNTLALIRGSPNPEAGRRLINHLLSPEVEEQLARSSSAQIPLNTQSSKENHALAPLPDFWMEIDFNEAASHFEAAAQWLRSNFLSP